MSGLVAARRLEGQRVALTGRLASLTRPEATALIRAHGGRLVRELTGRTSLLVVGQEGWPLRKDGRLSRKLQQARLLMAHGAALRVLSEGEFLDWLGLQDPSDEVCRRYTLLHLTRILRVPRDRLRAWLRAGLIRPVETVYRISYFDYATVTRIKCLCELVEAGVSLARLQRSLRRLRQWLPGAEDALRQLERVAGDGRLVFRLADGRRAEPHGQLLFDFEALDSPVEVLDLHRLEALSADDLFEWALSHEDAGQFAEAAALYLRWLETFGPDAGVLFNRGNSLYAAEDLSSAAAAFRAALHLDPRFVKAWSNLGRVLAEQRDHAGALRALHRALELDPGSADAHYNLADLLDRMGRPALAREHWRTYLRFDAVSEWADYARRRTAETAPPGSS